MTLIIKKTLHYCCLISTFTYIPSTLTKPCCILNSIESVLFLFLFVRQIDNLIGLRVRLNRTQTFWVRSRTNFWKKSSIKVRNNRTFSNPVKQSNTLHQWAARCTNCSFRSWIGSKKLPQCSYCIGYSLEQEADRSPSHTLCPTRWPLTIPRW